MRGFLALLVPLLCAACVVTEEAPDPAGKGLSNPPTPPVGSCGADALQALVGQPAAVLETMRFGQVVRVIHPGMAVTMDYSPDRLNVEVDADKVIRRVSCG
jgi:hypothetical protein